MRILVIDDDDDCRTMTCRMLELEGFETLEAVDGMDAFDIHRENPADLWVLDVFMPRWDGLEAIKRARQEFPNLPLVCMSASQTRTQNYSEVGVRFGADASLDKPFTPDELLAAVKEAKSKRN